MATQKDKDELYGAGGGGGTSQPTAKISKIMIWPMRKVNLGNFETVDLNAGVEMVFDQPVALDSPLVSKALEDARGIIKAEFKRQWLPYAARTAKN